MDRTGADVDRIDAMFLQKLALSFSVARAVSLNRRQNQMTATDRTIEKQRANSAILYVE